MSLIEMQQEERVKLVSTCCDAGAQLARVSGWFMKDIPDIHCMNMKPESVGYIS